jgi:hypothetical protein
MALYYAFLFISYVKCQNKNRHPNQVAAVEFWRLAFFNPYIVLRLCAWVVKHNTGGSPIKLGMTQRK